jgi:hypothetical protein
MQTAACCPVTVETADTHIAAGESKQLLHAVMQTQTFTAGGADANAHSSSSARPSSCPHAWRTTARSIACSLSTVSQEKRTIDIERVRAN